MTCGEETESECLKAIEPFRDKIVFQEVRNIFPQIKALNQMLTQVETPYLVPLDSDTILEPDAYDRIKRAIDKYSHDPKWHSILFNLWDTLTERQILALKVLRTDIMKQHLFADGPTPDVEHFRRLTNAGYTCIQNYLKRPPIGKHIVRGPHFCYHKYRDVYMTLRKYGFEWDSGAFLGGRTIEEKSKRHFDFFVYKHLKTRNRDYLYCIAGMVDGLTAELENCSKSLEKRDFNVLPELAIDLYVNWYKSRMENLYFF